MSTPRHLTITLLLLLLLLSTFIPTILSFAPPLTLTSSTSITFTKTPHSRSTSRRHSPLHFSLSTPSVPLSLSYAPTASISTSISQPQSRSKPSSTSSSSTTLYADLKPKFEYDPSQLETSPPPPRLLAVAQAVKVKQQAEKWSRHPTDCGSSEYQIASMTERVLYLTQHLKINPKDFSTRRGLVALVNNRRRLLTYLSRVDFVKYAEVIAGLGIRHKPFSKVVDRGVKYAKFVTKKKDSNK